MGSIFINYRRNTSSAAAGRLADRLMEHFDPNQVFMDVDAIEPGVDFVKALNDQVAQASAFIAVITPGWADVRNTAGKRRLDDPHDYVRVEIEAALKRDIRVLPVLIDGAQMVTPDDLPDSLKPLARRQAFEIAHHRFGADVDRLVLALQRILGVHPKHQIDHVDAKLDDSWSEFLFSFNGRIARKQFWLATLALIIIYYIVIAVFVVLVGIAIQDF
jgi:hypothetical protein